MLRIRAKMFEIHGDDSILKCVSIGVFDNSEATSPKSSSVLAGGKRSS